MHYRQRWNEEFLSALRDERLRQVVHQVWLELPEIDAPAAERIGRSPIKDGLIAAIKLALEGDLVSPRFVEAIAKANNTSWEAILSYWNGMMLRKDRQYLLDEVMHSLAEAWYAEKIEAAGAETDLQYYANGQYIDIFVGISAGLVLTAATLKDGTVRVGTHTYEPDSTLAIDFKAYARPLGVAKHKTEIHKSLRVGLHNCAAAAIATLGDYWNAPDDQKAAALQVVESGGGTLLVSHYSRADIAAKAEHILEGGRRTRAVQATSSR